VIGHLDSKRQERLEEKVRHGGEEGGESLDGKKKNLTEKGEEKQLLEASLVREAEHKERENEGQAKKGASETPARSLRKKELVSALLDLLHGQD